MPEGPELYLASRFVNEVGRQHLFSGCVEKSAVSSKNPDVEWSEKVYSISAQSRGKEVKLTLTEWDDDNKKQSIKKPKTMTILFRFGMSGKFSFNKVEDRHKHAHLNFFTVKDNMMLSFVDYRRFGRWEINGDWSKGRGPCVLQEYSAFRQHVLDNLHRTVFKKPICEVMLDQKFFNGIGNYLRAEILYRLKIAPFVSAKSVLQDLGIDDDKEKVKSEDGDLLELCNRLPLEVVNLDGKGYDPETGTGGLTDFTQWLRCYYKPGMKNMVDKNNRTIWFSGEAGPLKPKESKTRGMKVRSKSNPKKRQDVKKEGESPHKKSSQKAEETQIKVENGHVARGRLTRKRKSTETIPTTPKQATLKKRKGSKAEFGTPVQKKGTRCLKTPKRSKQSKGSVGDTSAGTRRSSRLQTKVR